MNNQMQVSVANSLDDLMKVMVIRGIIFVGEHGHKYTMEFDEHEFSNRTHLLAYDENKEPVGTMRIQTEGNYAKFERLAVLPSYRGKGVAEEIVKAGVELCEQQGVENVCLFCEPPLLKYWRGQNFERVGDAKVLKYRGLDLIPVMRKSGEPAKVLTEDEKSVVPPIMMQQHGEWVEDKEEQAKLLFMRKQQAKLRQLLGKEK